MRSAGSPRIRSWRWAAWAAAACALATVFASYLDPHLALDVANRLWSCL